MKYESVEKDKQRLNVRRHWMGDTNVLGMSENNDIGTERV